jgi:hypothetical protein
VLAVHLWSANNLQSMLCSCSCNIDLFKLHIFYRIRTHPVVIRYICSLSIYLNIRFYNILYDSIGYQICSLEALDINFDYMIAC